MHSIQGARVGINDGIATDKMIYVHSGADVLWVAADPDGDPRRVIPRPVVIESAFFIPFLAGVPVALRRFGLTSHCLIRRATVWGVLLVGDDLRLLVQLQADGAEVVAELVADELLRRRVVA